MATTITVAQGDSMASLAKKYGFVWNQLWDHPENAGLKELRKNPNQLLAGDEVFIPDIDPKTVSGATDKQHVYRRLGIPSKVRVQFFEYGLPRANRDYTMTLDDGTVITGTTDADGFLQQPVQPERKTAVVVVGGEYSTDTFQLNIGHLDPVDTVTGAQQRLSNLGYKEVKADGEMGPTMEKVLRQFQSKEGLDVTGQLDDATRAKILELNGS